MNEQKIKAIAAKLNPSNRIDITVGIEGRHTNPNGDPDRSNRPRTIKRLGNTHGLMTGECIKNKIRKFLATHYQDDIFTYNFQVKKRGIEDAMDSIESDEGSDVVEAIVKKFIDIRFFGSVMSYKVDSKSSDKHKKVNLNSLKSLSGPIQVSDAITLDPVKIEEISITSQQVSNESQADNGTFGSRSVVDHGLYETTISFSPYQMFADSFTNEDLEKLLMSLAFFGQVDQASNRKLETKYIVVSQHSSPLGDGTFSKVTGRSVLKVERDAKGEYSFELTGNEPEGVECHLIG